MKSTITPGVAAAIIAVVVVVVAVIGYKVLAPHGANKAADKAMESQYTHGGGTKMDPANAPSMKNMTPPPGAMMPRTAGGPPMMGGPGR